MTTPEIIGLVALAMNASAIIWGASNIAAAVNHLEGVVAELKLLVFSISDLVHGLATRVSVLEDRDKRNDNETIR